VTGDQLGSILRSVLGESIEVQLSSIRRYGELRQQIASGEWDEQWVNQQFLDYVRAEGPSYRDRLTSLTATYQRDVAELNREFSERFYVRLQRAAGGGDSVPSDTPAEEPTRTIPMELHGFLGTEAVGVFTLHNHRDQPTQVTFELGDIVGEGGRLPYRMLLVEPEAPVLAPGERRQAMVRVALIQGLFRVGNVYSATIGVRGHERFVLVLTIHVTAPEERPPEEKGATEPATAPADGQPTGAHQSSRRTGTATKAEGERGAGQRASSAEAPGKRGSRAAPGSPSAKARPKSVRTRPLAVSRLLDEAVRSVGLDDFGDPTFQEGLTRLIDSAAAQADLNPAGWELLTTECQQALANRLRVTAWRHAHPEVADSPVRADFIIGMPRTGTTALSQLLAQDPGNRSLRGWEAIDSVPPPTAATYQDDPRFAAYRSAPHPAYARNPGIRAMHYDASDDPVEDTILLAQHFAAVSVTYRVPDYNEWVVDSDLTSAYRFHQQVLQLLQSGYPGMWMLKSPGHSFGLEALRNIYPNARFVMIHRDPVTVTASMLSTASSVLAVFSDSSQVSYVANYWPKALATMAERIVAFRQQHDDAAFFDVSYEDLIASPIGVVQRLYAFLGRELTPAAERRMTSFSARRPANHFGTHVYRLSDFGVNPAQLQERFREYCNWFSLSAAPAQHG
jgi:Sulfotransferase family